MVGSYLAKVCINSSEVHFYEYAKIVAEYYKATGRNVYFQVIDNTIGEKWLAGQKTMYWGAVVNIYSNNESCEAFTEKFKIGWEEIQKRNPQLVRTCDVYVAEEMAYKEPLNSAEIITSCYEWNYFTEETLRNKVMKEHFLLEQGQIYYDFVSFQSVKAKLYDRSKLFDFFFESHVSKKDGIDKIYGGEGLEEMRTHSKLFLNTETRHLAFGTVAKY